MIIRRGKPARDNRCGVDSRTAWTCAPCKIVSQLRHNHVVPALTGRCICVWSMYKYSLSRLCIRGRPNTTLCLCRVSYFFFSRAGRRGGLICVQYISPEITTLSFSLFLHSFLLCRFTLSPFPFPFLFASLPHSSPYIPMYVYMYIYIAKALVWYSEKKPVKAK